MRIDNLVNPTKTLCLHCESEAVREAGDNFYTYSYRCKCKEKFGSSGVIMGGKEYKLGYKTELCGLLDHDKGKKCKINDKKLHIFKKNNDYYVEILWKKNLNQNIR